MPKLFDSTTLLTYCGFIYYLSSQSSITTPILFTQQDKLHHLGAYFIMGILAWRVIRTMNIPAIIKFLTSLIFCSLYGFSDEWHQSFVPGRDADVLDWTADTLGAFCSISLYYLQLRKKIKQTSRH